MQSEAYLGLGSNLGDRRANLLRAVETLGTVSSGLRLSPLYETQPAGFDGQPPLPERRVRPMDAARPLPAARPYPPHPVPDRRAPDIPQRPAGHRCRSAPLRALGHRDAHPDTPSSANGRARVRPTSPRRPCPLMRAPGPEHDGGRAPRAARSADGLTSLVGRQKVRDSV